MSSRLQNQTGGRERQIKRKQVMCIWVCASSVPQNYTVLLRQCPEPNKNLLSITEPLPPVSNALKSSQCSVFKGSSVCQCTNLICPCITMSTLHCVSCIKNSKMVIEHLSGQDIVSHLLSSNQTFLLTKPNHKCKPKIKTQIETER